MESFFPGRQEKHLGTFFDTVLKSFPLYDTRMGEDSWEHVTHTQPPDGAARTTDSIANTGTQAFS